MRLAFFSPLPPLKSGIADYAAALLEPLQQIAQVTIFGDLPASFDPSACDIKVYQIGNNPYHAFAYEAALRYPGVVVLHEANLHHLIAEITIKRGDWDGYLRELAYAGGPEALAFGERVRSLEVGPDYEGQPLLRRLLEGSRAVIVHSECVAAAVRAAGFAGPVGVVPHGAWLIDPPRQEYRARLGLSEDAPLIGIFGFLKPYKRIAESLRAFRRLLRTEPSARLLLVGEEHTEFPVGALVQRLGIEHAVRLLGFTAIDDFNGYLGACDIILNLRYPTVGESSGTLLRALGMGKAVLVSDVGSFAEYPGEICLKVPVDASEEDVLYEYLSLLTSRPSLARAMGERARAWVGENCSWPEVARRYLQFLEAVQDGRPWEPPRAQPVSAAAVPDPAGDEAPLDAAPATDSEAYLLTWAPADRDGRGYVETHLTRLAKTLSLIPPGTAHDRILEMGAYLHLTPSLRTVLGYGEVRGCYYGAAGTTEHKSVTSQTGEQFACEIDLFDAEKDAFPYPDGHFATVVCGELIEHLFTDPMHMMAEISRVLRPEGHLILTTPNIGSLRAIAAILTGYHPGFFPAYIRPTGDGETDARHNREYTPQEIAHLFHNAGFEMVRLETGEFRDEPHPEHLWVQQLLARYQLLTDLRGDGIYAVGRKAGPVRDRWPNWLYQ